jgi:CRP-like cAMP-binding protein
MADMLSLSSQLPETTVSAGEVLVREGDAPGPLWVLVSGSLVVTKSGEQIATIDRPGAVVGEMAILLSSPATATVSVNEPARVRCARDGHALLSSDPEVSRFIAVGLAERLQFVTAYLADLKHQYGDVAGMAMVTDVLSQLTHRSGGAQPGSKRDPDPLY